jgi:aminopeptidase-like protein
LVGKCDGESDTTGRPTEKDGIGTVDYFLSRSCGNRQFVDVMSMLPDIVEQLVTPDIGDGMYKFAAKIFPICRSITGNGVRETLREIGSHVALDLQEVASGTAVFDWVVPREWNIRDAFIKDARGQKIVDFRRSNLHVMSYSVPVHLRLPLAELKNHLHSLPEQPDLVPYRTSYYSENWGFCVPHRLFESLRDEVYEVVIDSTLADGSLSYGEYLHKGKSEDEFLLSAHVCHPSLANDNCSGLALLAHLASRIGQVKTRYSYRFLFAPGTIGAITWLARNEKGAQRIKHGLVLSMVGDGGGPTYKKSRRGNAKIDRAVAHVFRHSGLTPAIIDFFPYGYDERQYCSPGFNLPVGLFQRSKFGEIAEYHTSADNLSFISAEHLAQSYHMIVETIDIIENDVVHRNLQPKCEPQLGRRGLYGAIGGDKNAAAANMAMLWILNLSDGQHSLLDIAERADLPFGVVRRTAHVLRDHDLLATVDHS